VAVRDWLSCSIRHLPRDDGFARDHGDTRTDLIGTRTVRNVIDTHRREADRHALASKGERSEMVLVLPLSIAS